ncbi:hypothetical protein IWQ60_005647 [Tieghemiomyces parasiticus]|uniref:Uncharacterized protein n=1 Tax=Tieghemiomyces parasiticus TaxID=78921 RepID=A0A9W8DY15_9FUNG|nr:hypothetical protein IWQ60_005647 [Tieghemiomyces parasiticus]
MPNSIARCPCRVVRIGLLFLAVTSCLLGSVVALPATDSYTSPNPNNPFQKSYTSPNPNNPFQKSADNRQDLVSFGQVAAQQHRGVSADDDDEFNNEVGYRLSGDLDSYPRAGYQAERPPAVKHSPIPVFIHPKGQTPGQVTTNPASSVMPAPQPYQSITQPDSSDIFEGINGYAKEFLNEFNNHLSKSGLLYDISSFRYCGVTGRYLVRVKVVAMANDRFQVFTSQPTLIMTKVEDGSYRIENRDAFEKFSKRAVYPEEASANDTPPAYKEIESTAVPGYLQYQGAMVRVDIKSLGGKAESYAKEWRSTSGELMAYQTLGRQIGLKMDTDLAPAPPKPNEYKAIDLNNNDGVSTTINILRELVELGGGPSSDEAKDPRFNYPQRLDFEIFLGKKLRSAQPEQANYLFVDTPGKAQLLLGFNSVYKGNVSLLRYSIFRWLAENALDMSSHVGHCSLTVDSQSILDGISGFYAKVYTDYSPVNGVLYSDTSSNKAGQSVEANKNWKHPFGGRVSSFLSKDKASSHAPRFVSEQAQSSYVLSSTMQCERIKDGAARISQALGKLLDRYLVRKKTEAGDTATEAIGIKTEAMAFRRASETQRKHAEMLVRAIFATLKRLPCNPSLADFKDALLEVFLENYATPKSHTSPTESFGFTQEDLHGWISSIIRDL